MDPLLSKTIQHYLDLELSDEQIAGALNTTQINPPNNAKEWCVTIVRPLAEPLRQQHDAHKRSEAGKRGAKTRQENKKLRYEEESKLASQEMSNALETFQRIRVKNEENRAIANIISRLNAKGLSENAVTFKTIYESVKLE